MVGCISVQDCAIRPRRLSCRPRGMDVCRNAGRRTGRWQSARAGLAATGLGRAAAGAILTGSVGLLGDAIHNLSDVSTSAVVFIGFRVSRKAPTERYPYGLDRAEDLAGIGIAVVIWASAAFAGYESVRKLLVHGPTSQSAWASSAPPWALSAIRWSPGTSSCRQAHQLGDPRCRRPALPGSMPCPRPGRSSAWSR